MGAETGNKVSKEYSESEWDSLTGYPDDYLEWLKQNQDNTDSHSEEEPEYSPGPQDRERKLTNDGDLYLFDAYPRQPGESNEEYGQRLRTMKETTQKVENGELVVITKVDESTGRHEGESQDDYEQRLQEKYGAQSSNNRQEDKSEEKGKKSLKSFLAEKGYTDEQIDDAMAEGFEVGDNELDQWIGNTIPMGEKRTIDDEKEKKKSLKDYLIEKGYSDEQIDDAMAEGFEVGDDELEQWIGDTIPMGREDDDDDRGDDFDDDDFDGDDFDDDDFDGDDFDDDDDDDEQGGEESHVGGQPNHPEDEGPLVVINANFGNDKSDLAHDIAEQELNRELEDGKGIKKFIKQIWKGNLFKKYYEMKYTREFESGKRTIEIDGKKESVDSLIEGRTKGAISRFVLGVTDEAAKDTYIHKGAREGAVEASEQLTADIRAAIEHYASAKVPEGGNLDDLRNDFENAIERAKASARDELKEKTKGDDGKEIDTKWVDNYFEVAKQARQRVEHGIAIDRVMEGFKVYNAEVRDGVRTEAHRDNVDKIINKLESSTVGRVVPPEALAVAVSLATSLTQTGMRAAAGAIGGLGVSGVFAGLRERNRVTEDRTQMIRDAANGLEREKPASRNKKYEKKLGGTMYGMKNANELTNELNQAVESGDENRIMQAIAQAKVRIDYSDSEKKDLIAYSSEDARGAERLALDKALVTAKRSLGDRADELRTLSETIRREIISDVDEKDKDFRKLRAAQAMKQAGKTVAIGAVSFFASQEISSVIGPGNENRIGLIEKLTGKGNNAEDASETLLARWIGGEGTHTNTLTISESDVDKYKKNGYNVTPNSTNNAETIESLQEVDASDATGGMRVKWKWANNGTRPSDGNELKIWSTSDHDGFISMATGNSTMPNGEVVNADNLIGVLTIKGKTFECVSNGVDSAGHAIFGENGIFTLADGSTVKAIDDSGNFIGQYFQIAKDAGMNADGTRNLISIATEVGSNGASKISQLVEHITQEPTFTATKTVVRDVIKGGLVIPFARRHELGGVKRPNTPETPNDERVMTDGAGDIGGVNRVGATPESSEAGSQPANNNPEANGGNQPVNNNPEANGGNQPANNNPEAAAVSTGEAARRLTDEELVALAESAIARMADIEAELAAARGEGGGNAPEQQPDREAYKLPHSESTVGPTNLNGLKFLYADEEISVGDNAGQFSDEESLNGFQSKYKSYIESYKDLIGGDEGVELMTDTTPYTADKAEKYERWWNSLSDAGRAAVSVNMNEYAHVTPDNTTLVPWNAGLRVWLIDHGYKTVESNPGQAA